MMAESSEFGLIGIDELMAKLDSVTDDVRRRGGRSSLRKAAMVIVRAAKENAARIDDPDTGRQIGQNVGIRWNGKVFKSTGNLAFRIGVLGGGKIPKGNPDAGAGGATPHWHLIELGFDHTRAGKMIPPQPFLRPALANNVSLVTDTFVREFEKAIDRAIKRAAKKAAPTSG